ncbi:MAG: response regulator [Candidatus Sericytochromatia bacterium]|uniref:Response regulator n=1 Tax=Candidatus Tanganyikabacteria bacterium TaxID=2961651 RepID=A0A937X530_9BACT|nr:response regulator [Candidatus Tanganyikabacteria bacterium]
MSSRFARDHQILIAGSQALVRRNLTLFLQREGFDVVAAETARDVLIMGPHLRPSAFLLEAGVPGMSGTAVCQCLREMIQTACTPIILYSADSSTAFEALARSAGAQCVLSMPLDAHDIVVKVANAILQVPSPGDAVRVQFEDGSESVGWVRESHRGNGVVLEPAIPISLYTKPQQPIPATFQFVDSAHKRTSWLGEILEMSPAGVFARLHDIIEQVSRRSAYRKLLDLPVRYSFPQDSYRWGKVVDLSVSGFRLAGDGKCPPVESVGEATFTLGLGGRPIRSACLVRWTKAGDPLASGIAGPAPPFGSGEFQSGLAFYRLPAPDREALLSFLFHRTASRSQGSVAV